MTVLRIEHLQRAFGSLVVTNDVTLTVEDGERHVIIGPNGAGKTSLINQIGGQLAARAAAISSSRTATSPAGRPTADRRLGIARTFQRNNLFQNLTVAENLRLAVQIKRGNPLNFYAAAQRDARVVAQAEALLAQVHLDGDRRPSGAQSCPMASSASSRSASRSPASPLLLLLDEPTSGMSPGRDRAHDRAHIGPAAIDCAS